MTAPLLASALITSHDGITGAWSPPPPQTQLPGNDVRNLELWDPWVRAAIYRAELFSRIAFDVTTSGSQPVIEVQHLDLQAGSYVPTRIARMQRPDAAVFQQQLDYVDVYAELRSERMAEILEQMTTPAAFLAAIGFLRPERARWTLELLNLAYDLAQHVEMRCKHALASRRPIEWSPQVQPMIPTPGHSSLPSGHATEAFTLARVLLSAMRATGNTTYADSGLAIQLMRLASRIAVNRTVAGVHFPVDSLYGAVLGLALARYLVRSCAIGAADPFCTGDTGSTASTFEFEAPELTNHVQLRTRDFHWTDTYDPHSDAMMPAGSFLTVGSITPVNTTRSAVLGELWRRAIREWS